MKKKKKARPRSNEQDMDVVKQKIFKYYIKEMEDKTQKVNKVNSSDTNFHLFQTIRNKEDIRDTIFNLTYFYDNNFTGNKDFMHIPNISNVLDNVQHYPIMLVSKKDEYGKDEILGTTTVKFENNKYLTDNPYFPTKGEDILSITGVLTKMNAVDKDGNKIRGLGRELFKSAIKGAYNANKDKSLRLICEVDCRNTNSLYSVCKAVKELQDEGDNIQIFLNGYYEIKNKERNLVEAPTFILEIDLNGNKEVNNDSLNLDYQNIDSTNLFTNLSKVIYANTKESKKIVTYKNDTKIVFHSLEPINAQNITLNVGTTADGNNREPILSLQLEPANKSNL